MNTIDSATNVVQSVKWIPANPGASASTTINAAPPTSCNDAGAFHVGRVTGTVKLFPTKYLRGNTSSTTNNTTNGIDGGKPDKRPLVNHFVHNDANTPIPKPPTNVNGRL